MKKIVWVIFVASALISYACMMVGIIEESGKMAAMSAAHFLIAFFSKMSLDFWVDT